MAPASRTDGHLSSSDTKSSQEFPSGRREDGGVQPLEHLQPVAPTAS